VYTLIFLLLAALMTLGACADSPPPPILDITLVWDKNVEPDIIGYNVYYKTGSDEGDPYSGVGLNEGNSPVFTPNTTIRFTGCVKGVQYIFVVTAINSAGESKYSNSASCICGGNILW
jgi:hypothetical protein